MAINVLEEAVSHGCRGLGMYASEAATTASALSWIADLSLFACRTNKLLSDHLPPKVRVNLLQAWPTQRLLTTDTVHCERVTRACRHPQPINVHTNSIEGCRL